MIGTIVIFLVVLSVLVLVHEAGHFFAARFFGVHVDEFGLGFPPRAWGVKKGKTLYSLNWIPLGGFVKLKGESGDHAHDKDSFAGKPVWQRSIIIAGGVIMNVVLAWFLFTVGYALGMPQVAEDLPSHAKVRDAKVQVMSVLEGSAAAEAGVLPGDVVTLIDGALVDDADDVRSVTSVRGGSEVKVTFVRGTETVERTLVPRLIESSGQSGIGVALALTGVVSYPIYTAPLQGLSATWFYTSEIFGALWGVVRNLFTVAQEPAVEFSGPVGIAVLTSEVAALGFVYLLQFMAILSLNLAVVNVLPIPALDGGRLAFLIVEKIRGKAAGMRFEAAVHGIGYILLLTLVALVTYRDLTKFGGRIMDGIKTLVWGA